jgi:hypothetical protein
MSVSSVARFAISTRYFATSSEIGLMPLAG